jgi:phenylacetate-CoA ligase
VSSPIHRPTDSVDFDAIVRLYPPAPEFFETRWLDEPDRLEHLAFGRLKTELERAAHIGFYERLWEKSGFTPSSVHSLRDLTRIPTYTVDDIRISISLDPPFGDYQGTSAAERRKEPARLFFSGGTTGSSRPTFYTPWDREVGALLTARAYYLAGLRPGDLVLNSWAYGIHQGAACADEALYRWLGATAITTSSGQVTPTIRQVEIAAEYGAASILTIGDYLLHMARVALEIGLDPKKDFSIRCFPVPTGGLADKIEEAWGAPAYDSYGFHEVNYVAIECPARGGLHILEDAFVVRVVDIDTGEPLPDGEQGNLVVHCLYKTGSAQIGYNTQDLARIFPRSRCACGSWMRKMDYFAGRSDNMIKLRGTNVWPEAVGRVATADARVGEEYFVVAETVEARDELTVRVESELAGSESAVAAAEDIAQSLRAKLGVRIRSEVVAVGTLDEDTGRLTLSKPKRFEDRRDRT